MRGSVVLRVFLMSNMYPQCQWWLEHFQQSSHKISDNWQDKYSQKQKQRVGWSKWKLKVLRLSSSRVVRGWTGLHVCKGWQVKSSPYAGVVNPEPLQPAATAGSSGCNLFSEIPLDLLIYSALPGWKHWQVLYESKWNLRMRPIWWQRKSPSWVCLQFSVSV